MYPQTELVLYTTTEPIPRNGVYTILPLQYSTGVFFFNIINEVECLEISKGLLEINGSGDLDIIITHQKIYLTFWWVQLSHT